MMWGFIFFPKALLRFSRKLIFKILAIEFEYSCCVDFFFILSVWINMIEWMKILLNKTCNFRLLFSVNFAKMKSRYLMSLFIKCNDHYLWDKRGNPVDFNKDYKYNFWYYITKIFIFTTIDFHFFSRRLYAYITLI